MTSISLQKHDPNLIKRCVRKEMDDLKSVGFWRAGAAEALASLFICYMVHGTLLHSPDNGGQNPIVNVALASGFYVGVMIMSTDWVSGGHINPAVSTGFVVSGRMSVVRYLMYIVFQTGGGVIGYSILKGTTPSYLQPSLGIVTPKPHTSYEQALMTEFMCAFLLIFVVMAGTDGGRSDVKGSIPLMVGLTVSVGIFCGSNTSGGIINPALVVGPAIFNKDTSALWVYWVGDVLGGAVAGVVYNKLFSVKGSFRACLQAREEKYDPVLLTENDVEMCSKPSDTIPASASTEKLAVDQ